MCLLLTTSTKSNPSHVTKLVEFSYGPQETTGLQKVKKKNTGLDLQVYIDLQKHSTQLIHDGKIKLIFSN